MSDLRELEQKIAKIVNWNSARAIVDIPEIRDARAEIERLKRQVEIARGAIRGCRCRNDAQLQNALKRMEEE